MLVLVYGSFKFRQLINTEEYNVTESNQFDYFDEWSEFGHANKFGLAAGLIAWDRDGKILEDPTFGILKFYRKSWTIDSIGEPFVELPTHYCNEKDLSELFYP